VRTPFTTASAAPSPHTSSHTSLRAVHNPRRQHYQLLFFHPDLVLVPKYIETKNICHREGEQAGE
jgi:hypothetical protein